MQKVKFQGHARPQIDFKAWWRHHSWPHCCSSSFSSLFICRVVDSLPYDVCFRASCCQSLCATRATSFVMSRHMKCIYCLSTSGHMSRYVIFH